MMGISTMISRPLSPPTEGAALANALRRSAPSLPEAWIALAAARGPSPRTGPLRHDLLLPTPDAPGRRGLNVFGDPDDGAIRALVHAQLPLLGPSLASASDATWNAGIYQDADGVRVKLYLTGAFHAAVRDWPLPVAADHIAAVGMDLSPQGVSRRRVYLDARAPAAGTLAVGRHFATPLPWPWHDRASAHGLLTVGLDTGKCTRNWIFRPDAPLEALRAALPPAHQDALYAGTAAPLPPGLAWAPVALEADTYPDGRVSLDWLLTVRAAT
jgi:hypothetical protein